MPSTNIEEISRKVLNEITEKATEDLYNAAKDIMDNFYADYTPREYIRTGGLKNGTIYQKRNGGNIASISVDGSGVPYHKWKWSKGAEGDFVFDLMWSKGIRGLPESGKSGWYNFNFMTFTAVIYDFGISAGSPDAAMQALCDYVWETKRKNYVDAVIGHYMEGFEIYE